MNKLVSTGYHNGTANTSTTINVSKEIAWKKISNIINLDWLKEIEKTAYITEKRGWRRCWTKTGISGW